MSNTIIFWLYMANAIFLINHEVDSAYWEEWKLFKLPGGIAGFLVLHFPLWFLLLFGLIGVYTNSLSGMIISLAVSSAGIFAFIIHTYFIRKGNREFTAFISRFILTAILIISIIQFCATIYYLFFFTG